MTAATVGRHFDVILSAGLVCQGCRPQICINIHPDAVPPIHAKAYHVATDKGPLQVPVYF